MLRLDKSSFENFYKLTSKKGLDVALNSLIKINDYLLSTKHQNIELVSIERNGSIFTIEKTDFEEYKHNPDLKGREPTIWNSTVHCGSTFASKQQIYFVGGYANSYHTWGFEDSDLQWKLQQVFGIKFIDKVAKFNVLHLDHDKEYFVANAMKENEELLEKRKKVSVFEAITFDKKYFGDIK